MHKNTLPGKTTHRRRCEPNPRAAKGKANERDVLDCCSTGSAGVSSMVSLKITAQPAAPQTGAAGHRPCPASLAPVNRQIQPNAQEGRESKGRGMASA